MPTLGGTLSAALVLSPLNLAVLRLRQISFIKLGTFVLPAAELEVPPQDSPGCPPPDSLDPNNFALDSPEDSHSIEASGATGSFGCH